MMNQKKLLYIVLSVCLLVVGMLLYIGLSLLKPSAPIPPQGPTPTPYVIKKSTLPKSPLVLPSLPVSEGSGVNIQAPSVQTSIQTIEKLAPVLPYTKDYTLSTGLPVSIVIPSLDLQNNPWTLTIQIFGIDYQTSPTQENYALMKDSFKEAAGATLEWIVSQGVNPNQIYISWGDQVTDQKRIQSWLQ